MGIGQYSVAVPERRRYPRCIPEETTVRYSAAWLSYFPFLRRWNEKVASAVDLSVGGMCVDVPERIKPNTRLKMEITIPRYDERIVLEGIVRRCFENPKDGRIYAGIEFKGLPAPLSAKLRAMCEYFNSSYYKDRCREREEKRLFQ